MVVVGKHDKDDLHAVAAVYHGMRKPVIVKFWQ